MSNKSKTTATKEEGRNALVPKLRFPEFREAEGWAQLRLIDTADRSVKWSFIGGPFGSNLKSSDYVADGVRIIQLQNIGDGEFWADYRIFTSYEKANELLSNNIYPGDIIMSKMGDPVGRACLIPELHDRYVMCSDGIRLVVNEKENEKYFIYSLINSPSFRSVIENTATGSTRKRIGLDELKNLPMWLPRKPEQQKIAECLSSVDELIAAQARKLNALKTHKKGLMQQLFPREGETLPRLRFPEFQSASEWEEIELGQRMDIKGRIGYRGYTVEDIVGTEAGAISLSPSNIDRAGSLSFGKATYISWAKYEESPEIMVTKDFTLLVKTGSTYGKAAFVKDLPWQCTINPQIVVLKPTSINPFFLYLLVAGTVIQSRIEATVVGGAIPTLSQESISKFKIYVPSRAEQQRIADCLTSLDDLIAAQTQTLEALKTHKQGLMQQLFPSPEAVEV